MEKDDRRESELNRYGYLHDSLIHFKEMAGERIIESRSIFQEDICLLDPHTHSTYSDGRGSVSENYEIAMTCGLDHVYVTDHDTIQARKYSKMLEGISWGQEAGEHDHVVILHPEEPFLPSRNMPFPELYAAARVAGSFVFVAHPAGQGVPREDYHTEIRRLKGLGPGFAMEVMNGIFQIFRSWDSCDRLAVSMWDQLLRDGWRVTPVGSSDAHEPFGIGSAWTGVFASPNRQAEIVEALNQGNCFVSEAPLVKFTCNDRPPGVDVRTIPGERLSFAIKAADSFGLRCVHLIGGGNYLHSFDAGGEVLLETVYETEAGRLQDYYRVEVVSADDRRALSAPVYTVPKNYAADIRL